MTEKKGYTEENAKTIDQWVDDGWIWGMPISHEVYERAMKGDWDMVLTPTNGDNMLGRDFLCKIRKNVSTP